MGANLGHNDGELNGHKWDMGVYGGYLWLAGNEGIEKQMETTIMGYIGTTIRIHSFIPS